MFRPADLPHLWFFDVETASGQRDWEEMDDVMRRQWEKKAAREKDFTPEKDPDPGYVYHERAALFPEFGRVVCVSVGRFVFAEGETLPHAFSVTSYHGPNERALLEAFGLLLQQWFPRNPDDVLAERSRELDAQGLTWAQKQAELKPLKQELEKLDHRKLVGHNILGFDVPYLCRRMLIHRLALPTALQVAGRKPWDLKHLADTQSWWQMTDTRGFVGLELLCGVFGIQTPKNALGGEYVTDTFWKAANYEAIAHYCELDVFATAQISLAMSGLPNLPHTQLQPKPRSFYPLHG
jgi:hypothetical protein